MSKTVTISEQEAQQAVSIHIPSARSVKAQINYLDRSVDKPYLYINPPTNGEPANNHVYDSPCVNITDLRGTTPEERQKLGFTTEQAGFQIVDGFGSDAVAKDWAERKWDDEEWIQNTYYKDLDQLMKRELGVTSTFVFDHTIRKRRTKETEHIPDDPQNRKPVALAHCDQSRWAGENRIIKHLGEEVLQKVKNGELHAQLINVWRPLRGEAWDYPLAVADSRTVSRGTDGKPVDWRMSELRYPDWTGQTLMIHKNPDHRWYYYSGLPTDKTIFLKCYDSVTETRTPHTAFVDPSTPEDAEPRWSVEARVLTITDPKLKQ